MLPRSWRHLLLRPPLRLEPLDDRCLPASGLSASLVADIVPGADSSVPYVLQNVNGTLYFGAVGPTGQTGVYKSDGTAAGTALLTGGIGSLPTFDFTPLGGSVLFFTSGGPGNTAGLWKTDGTPGGTALLSPVPVAEQGNGTLEAGHGNRSLEAANGKVFFAGFDSKNGWELWASDGTTSGTALVKDIYSGSTTFHYHYHGYYGGNGNFTVKRVNNSFPSWMTNVNGTLYFAATDGKNGRELWKSDGTAKGTQLVADINPGSGGSNPTQLTAVNGALYFFADDGAHGTELWKSDGTAAGTVLVKDINPGVGSSFSNFYTVPTAVNGTLYFTAIDGAHGPELWKTDGTAAGTALVKDINPGTDPFGPAPYSLTNVNGTLYFSDDDGTHGPALWKTDGTAAGTVQVKAIGASDLTNVNGLLYFAGYDDVHGSELWQSDGTPAGTVMVQDIYPGSDHYGNPNSSSPFWLVALNNKLYFAATDPTHGRELWDPPAVGGPAATIAAASLGQPPPPAGGAPRVPADPPSRPAPARLDAAPLGAAVIDDRAVVPATGGGTSAPGSAIGETASTDGGDPLEDFTTRP